MLFEPEMNEQAARNPPFGTRRRWNCFSRANRDAAMPRVLLSVVLLALVASGCATTVYQRAPERFDRYVEADVAEYVRWIDRELNLSRDQERRIERMLESRTRHLLANTPVRRHAHVYPFPREKRRHNAAQRRWW